jgi:hypothetical protein
VRYYEALVGINADGHGFCIHALRTTAAINALAYNADGTDHGVGRQFSAGRAHQAGRGREHVRCSRSGCLGPHAHLSHNTHAVSAAKRCERDLANTASPVIRYESIMPSVLAPHRMQKGSRARHLLPGLG